MMVLQQFDKNIQRLNKLNSQKYKENIMLGRIQAMNLNSKLIHPNMKAHLFKKYIRPTLCYGIENLELNGAEILEFKKLEGNAIKKLLRIPVRCKTTDLVDSLNIEQTNRYMHRMKLKFVLRLYKNDYIRSILEFQTEMKLNGSFIMEIATFLKLSFDFDLDTLVTTAENKIMELKLIKKPKDSMCNMPMVNKLRNLFNIKFLISDKLFELIKFEVKQQVQKPKTKKPKSAVFRDDKLKMLKTILLLTFILLFYYVIINMFTERIR